ncbi:MAG: NPCBM/NEW2 domain-containing protein [Planctomycetota bacterium]|nr:NPCBM/NEW2 domain-containing protein [Planctomycetota bacterium]
MFFFLITLSCETLMFGAVAPEVVVRSLDGDTQNGKWVAWTQDAIVLSDVEAKTGEQKIPLSRLGQVFITDSPAPSSDSTETRYALQLVDRSELLAGSFRLSGDEAEVVWTTGVSQKVPLALIRSVRRTDIDESMGEAWNRLLEKSRGRDRLAVRKGESIDYVEGVISGVTPNHVDFVLDGESIPVKWSKLAGLLFADRPDLPNNPTKCQVSISGGARIPVSTWKSISQSVAVQLPCGLSFEIPLAQLERIDFSQDKVTYLSDMTPLITEFSPYLSAGKLRPLLERFYGVPQDRSESSSQEYAERRFEIATSPMVVDSSSQEGSLATESYTEGLSLRSKSRLVYSLPPESRRFEARVGIDAGSRHLGNVQFSVQGDGRVLYEAEISGNTGPRDVSVPVAGLRRLELIVDYGKNQDAGDRLNLCNARIVK